MKYMGSKRSMLTNGLGHLILNSVKGHHRFVDLFCGSGAVSGFVAQNTTLPVLASDLQKFATTLTSAIICRTTGFDANSLFTSWEKSAREWLTSDHLVFNELSRIGKQPTDDVLATTWIESTRIVAAGLPNSYPVSRMYGGYYFSLEQALAIDSLKATVSSEHENAMLASLISAASSCAAAPGHTAQPFSTKSSSLPHLLSAWKKDIFRETHESLKKLSTSWANSIGETQQADAFEVSSRLIETDLVFIDPPYSEVQYSRFYHVLETITSKKISSAEGSGRYPPISQRPQSNYCLKSKSVDEFNNLMISIASQGSDAIVTFPSGATSNGLSGLIVEELSSQYFKVKKREVSSIFSTLGGNLSNRNARQNTKELILYLTPH